MYFFHFNSDELYKEIWKADRTDLNQSVSIFLLHKPDYTNELPAARVKKYKDLHYVNLLALNLTSQSLGVSRIQHVKMKKALDLTSKNLRLRFSYLICEIKIPPTL